jgi:hypothetical protein
MTEPSKSGEDDLKKEPLPEQQTREGAPSIITDENVAFVDGGDGMGALSQYYASGAQFRYGDVPWGIGCRLED